MALIDPAARIGVGNRFAANVVIGSEVTIGDHNDIESNVVIQGPVRIGDRNWIGAGTVVGGRSRQRFRERPGVVAPTDTPIICIGDDNLIFQLVTVHHPIAGSTTIGDRCSIGAHTHVAHDMKIGAEVIIAPGCMFGGYVELHDRCNIGLGVAIHPRLAVGRYAMVGLNAAVLEHVAPAATVAGSPARFVGPNREGLGRWALAPSVHADYLSALLGSEPPSTPEVQSAWEQVSAAVRAAPRSREVLRGGSEVREGDPAPVYPILGAEGFG